MHKNDNTTDFKLLKVISLLLDYPSCELFADDTLDACKKIVNASVLISPDVRTQIIDLIDHLQNLGELEAQSIYDGLFERGRSLSLWLFEHVHGESRDRGQAMVDLMGQYQHAGFTIGVKELPDYLPMYLEFLAYKAKTTEDIEIRIDIADISHIVTILAARLKQRRSPYLALFYALLQIAKKPLSVVDDEIAKLTGELRDDTKGAIDKAWEEEVVDFMNAKQENRCTSNENQQYIAKNAITAQNQTDIPVHWVGFDKNTKHAAAH
ncbi:nitrate reductase delta subunit NarJ [Moraxella macacae 0408225]|uniref:Nitrate reductase delta subunit NarJ n=1 Tax=Moraxella macacae 0408225 TaxID=1230338 RepID=L2F7L1_9GAMM|nr:nitrate reductase molybdenum cofactor assembly chaperone [Moraxella macacae]ELA09017.1 nitrate reductase delta subunit NarJ [Moraxella macacae 0408225]